MEIVSIVVAGLALIATGMAGGLAYGFRNARDAEREHNKYLREQISRFQTRDGLRSAA